MKLRHWMLALSSCLMITGAVASGCGSTEPSGGITSFDAGGTDVATGDTSTRDVTSRDAPTEGSVNTCQKDADFTQIPVPDASIGDAGANAGVCVSCVRTTCQTEANACAADCDCNNAVLGFIACIGNGGAITTCGAVLLQLPQASQAMGQALAICVYQGCRQACGVPDFDGGDAARDSAGDAPEGG
jgi:hypothetical protein